MNELPVFLFHQGTNYASYEFLGSHFAKKKGKRGVVFRVWAPKAHSVSVVGDFNGWDETKNLMERISENGIFETFIEGLKNYDAYKYAVKSSKGTVLKADPYAFHAETPSKTASKIYNLSGYKWKDDEYLSQRKTKDIYSSPVNIYEVNLGSWKKPNDDTYYSYRELAKKLVPYVKKSGYTHIEIMPIAEHPFDGSWGYQVTGYYACTSRYGTPRDFMYFVDYCHQNGIGVIMDWVPAHFPKDQHGLYEFDGSSCYEYENPTKRENKGWGTMVFDWGKNEVQSFLISNASFWFEKFHIDGLRVDAVASMLYLDYDKKDGEWEKNSEGGNYNLEAIAFFKKLNSHIFGMYPHALMIAEESTAFPKMTEPTNNGGLGFNFKWNMGWMNDVLSYVETDPYFRSYNHNKMTFSMAYAFSENYVLPISHDEVVHGKKSLLDKMPVLYEDKFSNVKTFMGYMMSHPGKKLMFMGQEFGQYKEWAYKEGLEFFMLGYEKHAKLYKFFKDINHYYLSTPAFYQIEKSWDGFDWILPDDKDNNVYAYKRIDKSGKQVIVLLNFSGNDYSSFGIKVSKGKYKLAFNSDSVCYGGTGKTKKRIFNVKKQDNFLRVDLPKFSFVYFEKID